MKIAMLAMTPNPIEVMWTSAKTCTSEKTPLELWTEVNHYENDYSESEYNKRLQSKWKLVKAVLNSGHLSIAEHANFTFSIEGISRACSHQLVRHRHCTFSQQSQRYVEIKENASALQNLLVSPVSRKSELIELCTKYFVDVNDSNYLGYAQALKNYLDAVANGMKSEDARNFLPNATKTNLIMTLNYAELMHICGLRLCSRAQTEIRTMTKQLVETVYAQGFAGELLASMLVPKCVKLGYCDEHKSCGKFPAKS